ncbi:hypothetical protein F5I97DRAFT_1827924 [Phlebopus sp. FC_14]|nr:hypothetical protein F5I97DRAFT_1827924 [Phlebopus sp. FC_14]
MFKLKNVPSARTSAPTPGPSRVAATQVSSTSTAQKKTSKFHPAPNGTETPSKGPGAAGTRKDPENIQATQGASPQKPSTIPETPERRKRLEAIEAGLKARDVDPRTPVRAGPFNAPILQNTAAPSAETSSAYAQSRAGTATAPSQVNSLSQASTEIDWNAELPPATPTRKHYSFLGLDPSPEPIPSVLGQSTSVVVQPEPSTPSRSPKKRRLSLTDDGGEPQPGMLLTPPQTTHRPHAHEEDNELWPEPVTPTRRKGKQRSNDSQGGFVMEDDDNPFQVTAARCPDQSGGEDTEDVLPQLAAGPSSGSTSSGSPTPGEQMAANLAGIKEPIRALQFCVDSLEKLQAGKYIQKLERQRRALELGNDAKKKKIAELMAEMDDLREKLRRSEASNHAKEAEITHLKARQRQ